MAQINFTIDDSIASYFLDSFCESRGYDSGSGLSKIQFAKKETISWWISEAKRSVAMNAAIAAQTAASQNIDSTVSPNIS